MHVYLLIDRSGSMQNLWNETISSINHYVSELDAATKVTMAVFDGQSYDYVREGVEAIDWNSVSEDEFRPRGMTPLYDSTAKIIDRMFVENDPKQALVVITDGHENCSKEYNHTAIMAKFGTMESKEWPVVFLGANFDDVQSQSSYLGVAQSNSMFMGTGNFSDTMTLLAGKTRSYAAAKGAEGFEFNSNDREIAGRVR